MDRNTYDILTKSIQKIAFDNKEYLCELNTNSLQFFNSDGFRNSMKHLSELMSVISGKSLQQNDSLQKSLKHFAERYESVISNATNHFDYDALANKVLKMSLSTSALLTQSNYSPMIDELIKTFAQADYSAFASIINSNLSKPIVQGSDIAFLKLSEFTKYYETELELPYGLKTSLEKLNKRAAIEIIGNSGIRYDIKSNQFMGTDSQLKSKAVNVVCDGKTLLCNNGEGELFTELELMDFVSALSRTPMLGIGNTTGKRILSWLQELYLNGSYNMGFDCEIYYHCRSRNTESMPYTYDEMMRAPYGIPKAGRFNQVGRAHFYFADSKEGAESEVRKNLGRNEILQTTRIKPVKGITMLDLSGTLHRGKSFLKYIRFPLGNSSNKMPKEYLLPCFVADCCKQIGFGGIKYYGSKDYSNYVTWNEGYFESAGMCSV